MLVSVASLKYRFVSLSVFFFLSNHTPLSCYLEGLYNSLLTLKVLNFLKSTSYCSLKPLWSGMGEVVPARTSPTLHPPSPPTVHAIVATSTVRVNL